MTPPDPTALLIRVTELETEIHALRAEDAAATRIFNHTDARLKSALAEIASLQGQIEHLKFAAAARV